MRSCPLLSLALATTVVIASTTATADTAAAGPEILEPITVEGQRTPLDSNAAVYRKRLPCMGSCEEPSQVPLMARVLARIKESMAATQMLTQPRIYEARSIQAPTLHRLEDKLP